MDVKVMELEMANGQNFNFSAQNVRQSQRYQALQQVKEFLGES